MLTPQLLRDMLKAEPFQPFRIVMNGGKVYEVRHPEFVIVGRSFVNIHESNRPESGIVDRFHTVSCMLMEHTEFLESQTSASTNQ